MLFEAIALYGILTQIGRPLAAAIRREKDDEALENTGVFKAQERFKAQKHLKTIEAVCLGGVDIIPLPICKGEVLWFFFGEIDVYITIPEMNYLNGVTQWDNDEVIGVLTYIRSRQFVRAMQA